MISTKEEADAIILVMYKLFHETFFQPYWGISHENDIPVFALLYMGGNLNDWLFQKKAHYRDSLCSNRQYSYLVWQLRPINIGSSPLSFAAVMDIVQPAHLSYFEQKEWAAFRHHTFLILSYVRGVGPLLWDWIAIRWSAITQQSILYMSMHVLIENQLCLYDLYEGLYSN